jgi:hypothetical protein
VIRPRLNMVVANVNAVVAMNREYAQVQYIYL